MTVVPTAANTWLETESGTTITDAGGWGTPLVITTQAGRVINVTDTARADTIRARLGYLPPPSLPPITDAEHTRNGVGVWTPHREGMG